MYKDISIFIGGSTNVNISDNYKDFAYFLGIEFNDRDYELLFDGCNGLPGLVYHNIKDKMKTVMYYNDIYKMPKLDGIVRAYNKQSDVTHAFINNCDAMIFMKGGMGTLSEISHAIDTKKNKEHDKPIVIININHEWDELINLLKTYDISDLYYVTDNVIDCLNYIEKNIYNINSNFYDLYIKNDFTKRKEAIIINDCSIKK